MRVTIVVPDNKVSVDGYPQTVDCAELAAEGKHAVQWYDTMGEVEFASTFDQKTMQTNRLPNEIITDFSAYQPYVDAWEVKSKERSVS
jgi:hypothetical protein